MIHLKGQQLFCYQTKNRSSGLKFIKTQNPKCIYTSMNFEFLSESLLNKMWILNAVIISTVRFRALRIHLVSLIIERFNNLLLKK